MAVKKRRLQRSKAPGVGHPEGDGSQRPRSGKRLRRSDEEKVHLVRQVMASGNQSAELKKVGIYPNQFYEWKKKFASQLGGVATKPTERSRGTTLHAARSVADEAKAFIQGKASLIERLKSQRAEIDELIGQLES